MIAYWVSALGLALGAGMGLGGLINPRWAANLVRLRDNPEKPGGFAEFRGTYGGLFLGAHGVALLLLTDAMAHPVVKWPALAACAVCGAMWIGTAIGRVASMALDGANTKFNQASVAFELGLGLAILAPWLF